MDVQATVLLQMQKRKQTTLELRVKVDPKRPFFNADKIPLYRRGRSWLQSNKCRSAMLTNCSSSRTRCHKGTVEAAQRSLCAASHSHPSSQLIRLIFTSITAVSHTAFHSSVRAHLCECEAERAPVSSVHACAQGLCLCLCAGSEAINICICSVHVAELISLLLLRLNVQDCQTCTSSKTKGLCCVHSPKTVAVTRGAKNKSDI